MVRQHTHCSGTGLASDVAVGAVTACPTCESTQVTVVVWNYTDGTAYRGLGPHGRDAARQTARHTHNDQVDLGLGWTAIYNALTRHWMLNLVPLNRWVGNYLTIRECLDRKDSWLAKV